LGSTSLRQTDEYPVVIGVGVLGIPANLGMAFAVGTIVYQIRWYWKTL